MNLPSYEVLCVGDSPSSDIRGGSRAGIDTCWYNPALRPYPGGEPTPDYTVGDIRGILDFAYPVS
jgi:FMN phosphatase YigB (HAD superfamily)